MRRSTADKQEVKREVVRGVESEDLNLSTDELIEKYKNLL